MAVEKVRLSQTSESEQNSMMPLPAAFNEKSKISEVGFQNQDSASPEVKKLEEVQRLLLERNKKIAEYRERCVDPTTDPAKSLADLKKLLAVELRIPLNREVPYLDSTISVDAIVQTIWETRVPLYQQLVKSLHEVNPVIEVDGQSPIQGIEARRRKIAGLVKDSVRCKESFERTYLDKKELQEISGDARRAMNYVDELLANAKPVKGVKQFVPETVYAKLLPKRSGKYG